MKEHLLDPEIKSANSRMLYYTPNGYIVPMEFCVNFFPSISAFSRHTKMHLNGILLIETEFLAHLSRRLTRRAYSIPVELSSVRACERPSVR